MPTRTNSLALTMACQLLHSARRPNGAPIHLPKRPLAAKRIHRGFGTGHDVARIRADRDQLKAVVHHFPRVIGPPQ